MDTIILQSYHGFSNIEKKLSPPLKDAFEELALSVSFFQYEDENVFEAAEIVQYVNAKKLYDGWRERERVPSSHCFG
jgi:hypothetical protein